MKRKKSESLCLLSFACCLIDLFFGSFLSYHFTQGTTKEVSQIIQSLPLFTLSLPTIELQSFLMKLFEEIASLTHIFVSHNQSTLSFKLCAVVDALIIVSIIARCCRHTKKEKLNTLCAIQSLSRFNRRVEG